MLIIDLDYVELVCDTATHLSGGRRRSSTDTYAVTVAQKGFAFADAGAIALGDDSLADTTTSTSVSEQYSSRGSLTKVKYDSLAEAEAIAISEDDNSLNQSTSTSRYSFKGYYV